MIVYSIAKETPSKIEKNTDKVEFSKETKTQIDKLSDEYLEVYRCDNESAKIADEDIKNRFVQFVKDYAPDVEVVPIGQEKTKIDKAYNWVFAKILRQREGRSHYGPSRVFYEENKMEYSDEGKPSSSNLGSFIAEVSHHINDDFSVRRAAKYAKDFVAGGFSQHRMYFDVNSVEFQAHTIAESAVRNYLFCKPEDFNHLDFQKICNTYIDICQLSKQYEKYGAVGFAENMDEHFVWDENPKSVIERFDTIKSMVPVLADFIDSECGALSETSKKDIFERMFNKAVVNKEDLASTIEVGREYAKVYTKKDEVIEGKTKLNQFPEGVESLYANEREKEAKAEYVLMAMTDDKYEHLLSEAKVKDFESYCKLKSFEMLEYIRISKVKAMEADSAGTVSRLEMSDTLNLSMQQLIFEKTQDRNDPRLKKLEDFQLYIRGFMNYIKNDNSLGLIQYCVSGISDSPESAPYKAELKKMYDGLKNRGTVDYGKDRL